MHRPQTLDVIDTITLFGILGGTRHALEWRRVRPRVWLFFTGEAGSARAGNEWTGSLLIFFITGDRSVQLPSDSLSWINFKLSSDGLYGTISPALCLRLYFHWSKRSTKLEKNSFFGCSTHPTIALKFKCRFIVHNLSLPKLVWPDFVFEI